jgi:ABC-type transport system substrate-binding protein
MLKANRRISPIELSSDHKENEMNRRFFFIIAIALLLLVAACSSADTEEPTIPPEATQAPTAAPAEPTAEAPSQEPVVLRVGGLQDVDCWNPFSCTAIYMWGDLLVEGFTDPGPASQGCPGMPALADSWEVSEDGLTWTIQLHEGITFSDGTPVTASTIKEVMEWWSSYEEIAVFNAENLYLESVEAVDDLTLRYTTFEPIINSPDYAWAFMWALPPSIWNQVDASELFTFENNPPVGTGLYVLAEYVPGSHMIFDAREDYYRGKPLIDRIIYTIFTNPDALNSALLATQRYARRLIMLSTSSRSSILSSWAMPSHARPTMPVARISKES